MIPSPADMLATPKASSISSRGRAQLWLLGVAAAALWAGVLWHLVESRMGGDLRAVARFATGHYHPPLLSGIKQTSKAGYDGQFYLTLATDPLLRDERTVRGIDNPIYRGNRIIIPLTSWLLALGSPSVASYLYMFLCWVLGLGSVMLAGALLRSSGRSPLWAGILLLNAGLVTSMFRGLPDAGALTLILAALLCHCRGRRHLTLLFVVLACLARETSILAALALAFHACLEQGRGRGWKDAALLVIVPLLFLLGLRLWLVLAAPGDSTGVTTNFGLPLSWLPEKAAQLREAAPLLVVIEVLATVAHLLAMALSIHLLGRVHRRTPAAGVFLLFGLMGYALQYKVWVEAYAYARVLIVLPFTALVFGIDERRWWCRGLLLSIPFADSLAGGLLLLTEIMS